MKKQVETIDITPTWEGVMPVLIAVLEDGTFEGKQMARAELMRLARLMDKINAGPAPLGPTENIGSCES